MSERDTSRNPRLPRPDTGTAQVIDLVLADDHQIMREGLAALLRSEADLRVISEASSGPEALECIDRLRPAVAVVDYSMPGLDGVGVVDEARRRRLPTAVVLLTMHTERDLARRALGAGAAGVVLKDDAFGDLAHAIRRAARGEIFVSEALSDRRRRPREATDPPGLLSPREREIAGWIARGLSNKEIARELAISVKTVETHRTRLMQKLDLHSVADLVRYAIRNGLAEP
ncbi:MAG: response regulator transcription factor [Myxococcota bacterium]